MSARVHNLAKTASAAPFTPARTGLLQRKCACGGTPGPTGECAACERKRLAGQGPSPLQTRLIVNQPFDRHEREADRVAEQVLGMPEPLVQRQVDEEEEKEELLQTKLPVQRRVADDGGAEAPPVTHEVLRSPGRRLDAETRAFFEPRFEHDFSQVRVHADTKAAASAEALGARAYTVGREIVFGRGQYTPQTLVGQRLLAHELTHVMQQSTSMSRSGCDAGVVQRDGLLEDFADFFTAGEVTFTDCTKGGHSLNDFAVIPEDRDDCRTFPPQDGVEHKYVDGFWWKFHSPATEWLKIPNFCEVEVTCQEDDGIEFSNCGFFQDSTEKGKAPRGPERMPCVENPFK